MIIPMAFLLSAIGGMMGIWLTYPITEALVAVLGYVIYKCYQNKKKGKTMIKIKKNSVRLVIDIQQ